MNKFAARTELIDLLLEPYSEVYEDDPTCAFWTVMEIANFQNLFLNPQFLENLYSHPLFYEYFFAKQTRENLYSYESSLFLFLLAKDQGEIFSKMCDNQNVIDFATKDEIFVNTLMESFQLPPLQGVSILGRIIFFASHCSGFVKLCSNQQVLQQLKAHPKFLDTLFLMDGQLSVVNRLLANGGGSVLETLCEDESFAKLFFQHENSFDAIVTYPGNSDFSCLVRFSHYPNLLVKFIEAYSQEHLIEKLGHPSFLNAFCCKNTEGSSTLLSCLKAHPIGVKTLEGLYDYSQFLHYFFKNTGIFALKEFLFMPGFREKLTSHPQFIEWFTTKSIVYTPDLSHSPLETALNLEELRGMLPVMLDNELISSLSLHDGFIDSFIQPIPNEGSDLNNVFHYLILCKSGVELLQHLSLNDSLMSKFAERPDFIELLFHHYKNHFKGAPTCAFFGILGSSVYKSLFKNTVFLQNLYSHPLFYNYFFKQQVNPELFAYGESLFTLLVKGDEGTLFKGLSEHQEFIDFATNNTTFITVLQDKYTQGPYKGISVLAHILNSPSINGLVKLCSNPPFLERLKAQPEFINNLCMTNSGGISMINRFFGSSGIPLFSTLCADDVFAKQFFEHELALDAILVKPINDFPCLSRLTVPDLLTKFIKFYSQDIFIDKLRNHEYFIPHLVQTYVIGVYKSSALLSLLSTELGTLFFVELCNSESFCEKLIGNNNFIDELITIHDINHCLKTPLLQLVFQEKGADLFAKMCENPDFFSNFVNHTNFTKVLSVQSTNNSSVLSLLNSTEQGQKLVNRLELLQKPQNSPFQFFAPNLNESSELEKRPTALKQNIL